MSPNATDNTLFATLLPHAIGATPGLGRTYIVSDGIDKKIITVLLQRQDKQPLTRTEPETIELFDAGSNNESLPAALTVTRHATPDGDPSGTSLVQSVCFEVTATTPGTWRLAARLRTRQGSIVLNQYAESSGNEQESNRLVIVAKHEVDCIKDADGLEWEVSTHPGFEQSYTSADPRYAYGHYQFRLKNGGRIKSVTTLPDLKEKLISDYTSTRSHITYRYYSYYLRNDVKTYTPPFQGFKKINFGNDNELRIIRYYEEHSNGGSPLPPVTGTPETELYMVVIDDKGSRYNVMAKHWSILPWPELPDTLYKQFTPDQIKEFFEEIEKNLNNR